MDKLTLIIDTLSKKLDVSAKFIFSALIKQAQIEAKFDLFYFFIFVGVAIIFALLSYFLFSIAKDQDDGDCGGVGIVSLLIAIAAFYTSTCFLKAHFTEKNNPEYWALTQIISQIKQ